MHPDTYLDLVVLGVGVGREEEAARERAVSGVVAQDLDRRSVDAGLEEGEVVSESIRREVDESYVSKTVQRDWGGVVG